MEVAERGWTVHHPLSCRPNLFACAVGKAAQNMSGPPTSELGLYVVYVDDRGALAIGRGATVADLIAGRPERLAAVLELIAGERLLQDQKWGEQNHIDGTGGNQVTADLARMVCQQAAKFGQLTWRQVLDEEVQEAFAESDPARLRAELVQVAAVAVAWIESIDRRDSRG